MQDVLVQFWLVRGFSGIWVRWFIRHLVAMYTSSFSSSWEIHKHILCTLLGVLVFGWGREVILLLVCSSPPDKLMNRQTALALPSFLLGRCTWVSVLPSSLLSPLDNVHESTQNYNFAFPEASGVCVKEVVGELVSQLRLSPTLSLLTARRAHEWTIWCDTDLLPMSSVTGHIMTQPSKARHEWHPMWSLCALSYL